MFLCSHRYLTYHIDCASITQLEVLVEYSITETNLKCTSHLSESTCQHLDQTFSYLKTVAILQCQLPSNN